MCSRKKLQKERIERRPRTIKREEKNNCFDGAVQSNTRAVEKWNACTLFIIFDETRAVKNISINVNLGKQ